jgi:hypothetical protein
MIEIENIMLLNIISINPVEIFIILLFIITILTIVIGIMYEERNDDEQDSGNKLEQPDK